MYFLKKIKKKKKKKKMCKICQKICSKAQYKARERILKGEKERIFKKANNLKRILERKYFPGEISRAHVFSEHTGEEIKRGGNEKEGEISLTPSYYLNDIKKINKVNHLTPIKEKNIFYVFPFGPGNPMWIPKRFFFLNEDGRETIVTTTSVSGGALLINPPDWLINFLKKNGTEVKFP